jgi:ribonucleoside-triphosphate reductase
VLEHPTTPQAVLVRFPVAWDQVAFDRLDDGREGNLEPAVDQFNRYLTLLTHWSDHNVSCTISYAPDEVPQIVEWMRKHWNQFIGVCFLFRANPNPRVEVLGYAYLPQEVVSKHEYGAYVTGLKEVTSSPRTP